MINRGAWNPLQKETNMDNHKKLLESIKRGILRIMKMRTKSILNLTLVVLVIVWAGNVYSQERGTGPSMTASGPSSTYVEPFGVPLAPGIYLANFMLLYFINPDVAANMPAYRAALPQEVYECLVENPTGCPYVGMAQYFAEQALEVGGSRNSNTFWPSICQIDPRWDALVPPEYRQPDQINQPLGRKKADKLARLLSMDRDMILTDEQYECMMGTDQNPPSNDNGRDIIRACLYDLTNSKVAEVIIPLSSYGLSLDDKGNVRSNCAPEAPCLEFNELAIDGSLDEIAVQCGFEEKLQRLIGPRYTKTPFPELIGGGVECQKEWGPESGLPCIVENTSPGKGGQ